MTDLTPASIAAADQWLAGASEDLAKVVRFVREYPGLEDLSSVITTLVAEYPDPRLLAVLLMLAARRLSEPDA